MLTFRVTAVNMRETLSFIFRRDRTPPQWARAPSFMRFLDRTQRRITVGRTHLDE